MCKKKLSVPDSGRNTINWKNEKIADYLNETVFEDTKWQLCEQMGHVCKSHSWLIEVLESMKKSDGELFGDLGKNCSGSIWNWSGIRKPEVTAKHFWEQYN